METVKAMAALPINPNEIAAFCESSGWASKRTIDGKTSWSLYGGQTKVSQVEVRPHFDPDLGYQVAFEANLTRVLHGDHGKALTLHPDDVPNAVHASLADVRDVFPFAPHQLGAWLVSRVDASATWRVAAESVNAYVTAADAWHMTHGGRTLATRYNDGTASLQKSKKDRTKVYDKGLEYRTAFRRGKLEGETSSPTLLGVQAGEVGLLRVEITKRSDKARDAYGRTLADMATDRHLKQAAADTEKVFGEAADFAAVDPDHMRAMEYFLSKAKTPNEGARLAGLYPAWKAGGVRRLAEIYGSRTSASNLAKLYREYGEPEPSPLPSYGFSEAVFAGRD